MPTPSLTHSQLTHYPFRFPDYDPAPRAVGTECRPYHWGNYHSPRGMGVLYQKFSAAKLPRNPSDAMLALLVRIVIQYSCFIA